MKRYNLQKIHRGIYLFGLALLITCLPLSIYFLSIAQFVLLLNWLAENNFRAKWSILLRHKAIILFASVFVLYALGYLYSRDKTLSFDTIKNALPLFVLPIIIGTSPSPGQRNIDRLLLLFCAGVTAAVIVCMFSYMANGLPSDGDFRKISVIMPHMRFAILIVMAIMILMYFAVYKPYALIHNTVISFRVIHARLLLAFAAVSLTAFLFFLRSFTGIMIFMILISIFILNASLKLVKVQIRIVLFSILIAVIISALFLTIRTWTRNFHSEIIHYSELDDYTINGNPYVHDTLSGLLENGNLTGLYLCEPELQREWEKVSSLGYYDVDSRGQPVYSTLKRYLTSKGLRKDSLAVHHLTHEDIKKIESGLANYKFSHETGIKQRLYETLYEIHIFSKTGFVERHTFGQRLAFILESKKVWKNNFWFGTGTGDVFQSLHRQMVNDNITVDKHWEGKPHNQFAFFAIAFGFTGICWIMFCWIYPIVKYKATSGLLFNLFALNILISMMVMDTLEAYSSMVFFVLFYSLLVFAKDESSNQ